MWSPHDERLQQPRPSAGSASIARVRSSLETLRHHDRDIAILRPLVKAVGQNLTSYWEPVDGYVRRCKCPGVELVSRRSSGLDQRELSGILARKAGGILPHPATLP